MIFTIVALIFFALAAFRVRPGRFNWIGCGLFFWALAGLFEV